MLRLAPLIARNVLRNRRRSLLTLASTAVSLALLAMVFAIYQGFFYAKPSSPSEALRLLVRHKVSLTQSLPASHREKIRAIPGVDVISTWTWFQGKFIDDRHFFARFGVDSNDIFDLRKDWSMPADQIENFKRERTACAIGEKIARDEKLKVGQKITIVGDIYDVTLELTVAGIYSHPPNTECLIFHQEYLTELRSKSDKDRDSVGTYLVLAKTPEDAARVGPAIDSMLENSPYPTLTQSEREFGLSFLSFLGNIKLFLAAICGAVTFTILLVSANTIAMSVRERTREIAILRTLGYTPGEITQLVLGESTLLSIVGGVIGIGLGYLLARGLSQGSGGFIQADLQWQAASAVIVVAVVIGALAAIVPAIVASRKNVVESLRYVG